MEQPRTYRLLSLVASLGLVAVLLLAVFVVAGSAVADQQNSPASRSSSDPVDPDPLVTANGGFTMYMPIIFVTRPFTFFDPFDDPNSGWPIHGLNLGDPDPPGPWTAGYGKEKINDTTTTNQNVYNVKTVYAWNSWIYTAPVVLADPANFVIQVDGKSAQAFMWASSWGLYFNANADRTQMYTMQIFQDSDGTSAPTLEVRRWDYFQGDADDANLRLIHHRCPSCASEDFKWTQIRVERIGGTLLIYAGGTLRHAIYAPDYVDSAHTGVGIYQGNFEWNDLNPKRYSEPAFQMDNFTVGPVYRR